VELDLHKVLELDAAAQVGPWVADIDDPQEPNGGYWTGKFYCGTDDVPNSGTWCTYNEDEPHTIPNLRLVEYYRSAAPEMAKRLLAVRRVLHRCKTLLLHHQYDAPWEPDADQGCCPECGGNRPEQCGENQTPGHQPDCSWQGTIAQLERLLNGPEPQILDNRPPIDPILLARLVHDQANAPASLVTDEMFDHGAKGLNTDTVEAFAKRIAPPLPADGPYQDVVGEAIAIAARSVLDKALQDGLPDGYEQQVPEVGSSEALFALQEGMRIAYADAAKICRLVALDELTRKRADWAVVSDHCATWIGQRSKNVQRMLSTQEKKP